MILGGRVALVTGGSRGIGRTVAIRLAEAGADVAVSYFRNRSGAEEVTAEIAAMGRRSLAARAQLGDPQQLERLITTVVERLGALDLFIHSAASGVNRPALETTDKHWDWTMDVNARSFLRAARLAVPHMSGREGACMVAISSLGAARVLPDYTLVGVSKAALEALVRYLAVELSPQGIRVNAVSSSLVETDALGHFPQRQKMFESAAKSPAGRLVTKEDVAEAVAFLVGPQAAMIRGQVLIVDGGYSLPII